jgi:hypothetical protein
VKGTYELVDRRRDRCRDLWCGPHLSTLETPSVRHAPDAEPLGLKEPDSIDE